MSVGNFKELVEHAHHNIECVTYGGLGEDAVNVAIECVDCHVILLDYDNEEL